eukprot:286374-Prymnesium_polylepis.1
MDYFGEPKGTGTKSWPYVRAHRPEAPALFPFCVPPTADDEPMRPDSSMTAAGLAPLRCRATSASSTLLAFPSRTPSGTPRIGFRPPLCRMPGARRYPPSRWRDCSTFRVRASLTRSRSR